MRIKPTEFDPASIPKTSAIIQGLAHSIRLIEHLHHIVVIDPGREFDLDLLLLCGS